MTTIIWSEGMLIADSRITAVNDAGEKLGHSDDLLKIRNPTDLTCKGEKVLAVGICGNAYVSDLIAEMDGQGVDILDIDFFLGLVRPEQCVTTLIVVTTKRCYGITRYVNGELHWKAQAHQHSFVSGICQEQLMPMLNKCHPIAIMKKAMEIDPSTGGLLQVWWPGIQNNNALAFSMTETVIAKLADKKYNWFQNFNRQMTSYLRCLGHMRRVRKALAI